MQQAIDLAIEKMRAGEGDSFGAIIMRERQVIGRGWITFSTRQPPVTQP